MEKIRLIVRTGRGLDWEKHDGDYSRIKLVEYN